MRIISGKNVGELNVKCINCNSYYKYDELLKRDNSKPPNEADGRTMDDLISRMALLNDLSYCAPELWQDEEYIKAKIIKQHAVDAAPVVHARWIETTIPANTTGHGGVGQDKKKGRLCSNCRCAFDAVLLWCDSFCPNCGAKMDGERRDDE